MYDDDDRRVRALEACARRLGCTMTRVRELVEHRVLRAY